MVDVCVPCPKTSLGDKKSGLSVVLNGCLFSARKPSMYHFAPISFLLQSAEALKLSPDTHWPFHWFGIGPSPSSLNTFDSGHIPATILTLLLKIIFSITKLTNANTSTPAPQVLGSIPPSPNMACLKKTHKHKYRKRSESNLCPEGQWQFHLPSLCHAKG